MSIKQSKLSKHSFFMNLALMQAHKNLGKTKENPAVGCVIVKNNCIIAAGCTGVNGRPHAERNAINIAGNKAKDSYLYVTLEPCSNYGKTPPCTKLIIDKKVKKVFFSIKDPDTKSYNKSIKKFKKRNIFSVDGILKSKGINFYKSYFKYKKKQLPYVTAKMAVSKDFFTVNKKSKWITNEFSRGRVHLLRSKHDCILTSVKTAIKDNSKFTCRINGLEDKTPTRVILDKNLNISNKSYIAKTAKKYRTIIFYNKNNKKKINLLNKLKIRLIQIPLSFDRNFNLVTVLKRIKQLGHSRIFLECGLTLTTDFLNKNLVDNFHLFQSNKNLGENGDKSFKKAMKLFFKKKKSLNAKINLFGDKLTFYKIK